MPSESHKRKVVAIERFFTDKYATKTSRRWSMSIDHDNSRKSPPPPVINNHRPDFYANSRSPYAVVIGEAKSQYDDLTKSKRSNKQIQAFIHYLADMHEHPQQPHDTALILCVALCDLTEARHFICTADRANVIPIHLIDETGFEHSHAYRS